jgi:hypothetical protein
MECKFCEKDFDTKSGLFSKHIKKEHNLNTQTEYFYSINAPVLCSFCKMNRKEILNWRFDMSETCSSPSCIEKNRRERISLAQKTLVESGKNNFQKQESKEKQKVKFADSKKSGTLYCQRDDVKKQLSLQTTQRNLQYNPMHNEETRAKMSASSKNKKLSEEHKTNISNGLKRYLERLSDSELAERLEKARKPSSKIVTVDENYTKLNDTFINSSLDIVEETKRLLYGIHAKISPEKLNTERHLF